jgi:hypothetical protein
MLLPTTGWLRGLCWPCSSLWNLLWAVFIRMAMRSLDESSGLASSGRIMTDMGDTSYLTSTTRLSDAVMAQRRRRKASNEHDPQADFARQANK